MYAAPLPTAPAAKYRRWSTTISNKSEFAAPPQPIATALVAASPQQIYYIYAAPAPKASAAKQRMGVGTQSLRVDISNNSMYNRMHHCLKHHAAATAFNC
jgi:hypothetical protein